MQKRGNSCLHHPKVLHSVPDELVTARSVSNTTRRREGRVLYQSWQQIQSAIWILHTV